MDSQVFYRKWRPQILAEVVGQEPVTQTLRQALARGRLAHAYLFCGPRGTGKTSTARILAKAANCLALREGEPCNLCPPCQAINEGRATDLIEIDAASNRSIDDIRELRDKVRFAPGNLKYKVYIIDEVHMLTEPAFNALLKTLEEPPPHVIFILATTEPHKVPATILSRCQRYDFRRLTQEAMIRRLTYICQQETLTLEPQALKLIARAATGSLRDAENLLEQLAVAYAGEVRLSQVQSVLGLLESERIKELASSALRRDVASGLAAINRANEEGLDLRQFHRQLVEYLRSVLLLKAGSEESLELTPEERRERKALAAETSLEQALVALKAFAQIDPRQEAGSSLPLEMALVECSQMKEAAPTAASAPEIRSPLAGAAAAPAPMPQRPPPPLPQGKPPQLEKPLPRAAAAPVLSVNALEPQALLEQLKANWKNLLASAPPELKKSRGLALLRSSCRPVAIEGNTIVLEFTSPFLKENIEKVENRLIAEQMLSQALGTPFRLRFQVAEKTSGPRPPVSGDQLIKAALDMGAKPVDEP